MYEYADFTSRSLWGQTKTYFFVGQEKFSRRYSRLRYSKILNQARAGHRRAWFLKIDPVRILGMHVRVCVSVHA